MKRRYDWIPDIPDHRDHRYGILRAPGTVLPPIIDMRVHNSPVRDQGPLGACTAFAGCGMLEFLHRTYQKDPSIFSPLMLYYDERVIEQSVLWDEGAMLRDCMKSLANDGVALESAWPYEIVRFATAPTAEVFLAAKRYRITSYTRLDTIDEMQDTLAHGFPFIFGFTVYESFESDQVAMTGVAPLPSMSEQVLGGHAVLCCGYDRRKKTFLCKNSWGTEWGQKGYFTLPFDYLADRNLSDDFWMARQ